MRGFFYRVRDHGASRGERKKSGPAANTLPDWEKALLSQATFEAGLMRTIIGGPAQELQCGFENTLQLPFYLVWISLMV
jgi:hypothetical protein